jgi:hypothetical protein
MHFHGMAWYGDNFTTPVIKLSSSMLWEQDLGPSVRERQGSYQLGLLESLVFIHVQESSFWSVVFVEKLWTMDSVHNNSNVYSNTFLQA